MSNQDLAKKFEAAQKQVKQAIEYALETARQAFRTGASEIFAQFPKLENFTWNQYTPYFNDGDECTFGVHSSMGVMFYNGRDQDWEEGLEDEELRIVSNAICEFLQGFDSEIFRQLFGDHAQITVSRKEIRIEKYDHD